MKSQYRTCRIWESSHYELRINFALATYTNSRSGAGEGHILLSRPLPWVRGGCSPGPMGSCTTLQGAIFKWHQNALEDGSSISGLLTLCQQPQHTKHLRPGASPKFLSLLLVSLKDHIPSEGFHSSCSLPPVSQTTPFLPSFDGSSDTLGLTTWAEQRTHNPPPLFPYSAFPQSKEII